MATFLEETLRKAMKDMSTWDRIQLLTDATSLASEKRRKDLREFIASNISYGINQEPLDNVHGEDNPAAMNI